MWSPKPTPPYSSDDLWVVGEGEQCRFKAQRVMPVEDVIAAVAHIVEHNELPETVEWADVRSKGAPTRSLKALRGFGKATP